MNRRAVGLALAVGVILGAVGLGTGAAHSQGTTGPAPGTLDANPIGKVLTVSGTAHIDHASAVIVQASLPTNDGGQTKLGDLVYRGDVVQTGADGAIGITFADGTSFSVSANAKMEINEFIYDPKGHANSTLLSLTKGTFSFIAGNVAHTGDMKVETPIGTMGIRGTAPRVQILDDGTVKFST